MPQDTPVTHRVASQRTPRPTDARRRRRLTTQVNRENIPTIVTSTPMVNRPRNSPLVLTPLADILNITPEAVSSPSGATQRRRVSRQNVAPQNQRRHSTMGLTLPAGEVPKYATTLPKFEEEYSPNALLPTGQELAMRGMKEDLFPANRRYFNPAPATGEQEVKEISAARPKKRNLDLDFLAIAQEIEEEKESKRGNLAKNTTGLLSNRMGDQTLDNLIDAILDSARKEEKKKKTNFTLRRRTLMKNQVETVQDFILSPSYAAGDDPCSDISFMGGNTKAFAYPKTPQPGSPIVAAINTPSPATPNPGTTFSSNELLQFPTPDQYKHQDTFNLATPMPKANLKRKSTSATGGCQTESAKKYKADSSNYFEVGLALTCVYV
ncbi:uncharacterized protein LOC101890339 [Musca domestica]|uniref:Uncharacterized protein LOC101890339 n=1 Tax=Musca domestica TaxID=7370 RepID=A0A9J7DB47_MUSDO|nr:uncharacterized protein LOC101890339 [Musca domestica]